MKQYPDQLSLAPTDLIGSALLFRPERRTLKQIEHWATIGRVAEENPDLPLRFVNNILVGLVEAESGDLSEYRFG